MKDVTTMNVMIPNNFYKFIMGYIKDTCEMDEVIDKVGLEGYEMAHKFLNLISGIQEDNCELGMIPNEPIEKNGIKFKISGFGTISEFKCCQDAIDYLVISNKDKDKPVEASDFVDLDIDTDQTVHDWLDTRYPDLNKYELHWSLYNHRDILHNFKGFKTVEIRGDSLLLCDYGDWCIVATPMCPE